MVEETLVQKKEVQNVPVVKMIKKIKEHKWDETLVITVLVIAALSILIILASYITVTGQAYSTIISKEGSFEMLNKAIAIEGSGKAKCSIKCKDVGRICILAHGNENLVKCDDKITGTYQCLCANTEKII